MSDWKRISTKKLLTTSRISVFEDQIELPDSTRTSYIHFGKSNDVATIIVEREDGKILVQKEYSYRPDKWLYQFPGGSIEDGETSFQGAERELAEETGLKAELQQIGWFYIDHRRRDSKDHVFIATKAKAATGNKDPEEDFIESWLSLKEINKLIKNGELVTVSALAAWTLYKER